MAGSSEESLLVARAPQALLLGCSALLPLGSTTSSTATARWLLRLVRRGGRTGGERRGRSAKNGEDRRLMSSVAGGWWYAQYSAQPTRKLHFSYHNY